jgi:alkylated DNA nucleotide flippase Atl1
VVNAQGKISLRKDMGADTQRSLLEEEGIMFDAHDRIDLKRYRWSGPGEVQIAAPPVQRGLWD